MRIPSKEKSQVTPVQSLWDDFFHSDEPINDLRYKKLRFAAKTDTRGIYYVAPMLSPKFHRTPPDPFLVTNFSESTEFPQLELNPDNKKTLIVIPKNDSEALEAIQVSKRSGAKVKTFNTPHGVELNDKLMNIITSTARKKRVERIYIFEIPPKSRIKQARFKARLKKLGITVEWIDHHYSGGMDLRNPISSLEQLTNALGYRLGPTSKIIAVKDRSSIHGLMDLGVSQNVANRFSTKKVLKIFPNEKYLIPQGELWMFRSPDSKMNKKVYESFRYLQRKFYPEILNTIAIDSTGIVFKGNNEVKKKLFQRLKPFYDSKKATKMYLGGDEARETYFAIQNVKSKHRKEFFDAIEEAVKEIIQQPISSAVRSCLFREIL